MHDQIVVLYAWTRGVLDVDGWKDRLKTVKKTPTYVCIAER